MTSKKIQKRDTEAFKRLFEAFYSSLCLFADKYLNDKEASQDIAQDAFVYIWSKNAVFDSKGSARDYLYKYVRDRSLNYLRNKKIRHEIEFRKMKSEVFLMDNVIEEETWQTIYNAIRTLSPKARQVIELSLDGLKNQEIADNLGVSINTVKTVKLRAFRTLRDKLEDHIFILFIRIFFQFDFM